MKGASRREIPPPPQDPATSSDPLVAMEEVATAMWCHECAKGFVARVDHGVEGQHEIACPYCGHPHYRQITRGRVTGERWNSAQQTVRRVVGRRMWQSARIAAESVSTGDLIRRRWLEMVREE